jgi:FkbM family methyltransferase
MSQLKEFIRRTARSFGYDLKRYDPRYSPEARAEKIFADLKPTVVLDIGANEGEYATELRRHGYTGRIISFEPRREAFELLKAKTEQDSQWTAHQLAAGDQPGTAEIMVSGNVASSSLLPMADLHVQALAGSETRGVETIQVFTLNDFWPRLDIAPSDVVVLKIDVQGFENAVLDGADQVLPKVACLYAELSLQRLYQGGPLIEDLIARLRREGFAPVSFSQAFADDRTAHLLQVDGTFLRLP